MKKYLLIVILLIAIAIPVLAANHFLNLLDQKTFLCPGDQRYCFLEMWKDGRLVGRRRLMPNESINITLLGISKCETGFIANTSVCRGRNLFGLYQNENCRTTWQLIERCEFGCVVNACANSTSSNYTTITTTTTLPPIRNMTEVNCGEIGGKCIPKPSSIVCLVEYYKTEDCRTTEKCCV